MADTATEHMVVTATPEQCFAVVSDVERYPEWAADIKQVVVDSRDAEGRPSQVTWRAGAFGRSTSYTLVYDYSGAPQQLSWKQTAGDITSKLDGVYRFVSAGEGTTEVTYTLEVQLVVPLPGFIKRRAQSRIMHTALEELRARVESSLTT
ncbi:MAG TPA: SRPBCC family protein [Acidimicrobiales bacterium]|nr:SRPBCC family protein [Acidimicrobiales bacterium]